MSISIKESGETKKKTELKLAARTTNMFSSRNNELAISYRITAEMVFFLCTGKMAQYRHMAFIE